MILVVSDTSAVSALLHIGQIGVLQSLYDQVLIPEAVRMELLRSHAEIPAFIQSRAVEQTTALAARRLILDEGEASAITLAEQIHADLLLIDEKKGREEAEHAGLRYIGLLGVLIEAKRRGMILALRPLLDKLATEAGFRFSLRLRHAVLEVAGEPVD